MKYPFNVIISGGGTGGHIYPAVAIANALKQQYPEVNILFVGAEERMEMEKVPAAGYRIVGLPVAGLQRRLTWKNLLLPWKIGKSLRKATAIIREFKPDVVVGVGGYASAPTLWSAQRKGIPTLIQEQNSYAGVTNKILAKRAKKICVAYDNMERFFPIDRIILTGNPIRQDLKRDDGSLRAEAAAFFGLDPAKKTILVVGGSLGARTLNLTIDQALPELAKAEVQWIWQTGKQYYTRALEAVKQANAGNVKAFDFIYRMDYAFAAADIVVSRAGAGTISELCVVAKPCLFVPSPNVSEDHQTKNAQALVNKNAAIMVSDAEALTQLVPKALELVQNNDLLLSLRTNIAALAKPDAANDIVHEILTLANHPLPRTPHPAPRTPHLSRVYFIGIGGIGMSALARYYKHAGAEVAGYDRTPSPLTAELEKEGIAVHYEDNLSLISENFKQKEKVLVIYTPAVPANHSELQFFLKNDYHVIKRAAALGHLAAGKDTLAVAGTHGKTTVTTLLAHLMTQTAGGCTAFLGGISKNYDTNYLVDAHSRALVAEADEFDRSFLQFFPEIAIVTAADPDHLDIYGTAEAVKQAFVDFIHQLKPGGTLIVKDGVELSFNLAAGQRCYRYSFDKPCDFYASNIQLQDNGLMQFDLHYPDGVLKACTLGIPGRINVENAVAAVAAAWTYGADMSKMKQALAGFSGVQRRFDVQVNQPTCTYIDDYAHHPEELRAAITSLRETYPGRKITGVFQPHLYSRTRDFADDFAESLSLLDKLILLDIYPARELPIAGVNSQLIFDKIKIADKYLCEKTELMTLLEQEAVDVLVTFGAGDIDRFVAPITAMLNNKLKGL